MAVRRFYKTHRVRYSDLGTFLNGLYDEHGRFFEIVHISERDEFNSIYVTESHTEPFEADPYASERLHNQE